MPILELKNKTFEVSEKNLHETSSFLGQSFFFREKQKDEMIQRTELLNTPPPNGCDKISLFIGVDKDESTHSFRTCLCRYFKD